MRYASRLRVCRRRSTSWEYESFRSVWPWLSSAIDTRVKMPQSSPFRCVGECADLSEQLHSWSHSSGVVGFSCSPELWTSYRYRYRWADVRYTWLVCFSPVESHSSINFSSIFILRRSQWAPPLLIGIYNSRRSNGPSTPSMLELQFLTMLKL